MVMVIETITVLYEEIDDGPQTTMSNKIHYWRTLSRSQLASQPATLKRKAVTEPMIPSCTSINSVNLQNSNVTQIQALTPQAENVHISPSKRLAPQSLSSSLSAKLNGVPTPKPPILGPPCVFRVLSSSLIRSASSFSAVCFSFNPTTSL